MGMHSPLQQQLIEESCHVIELPVPFALFIGPRYRCTSMSAPITSSVPSPSLPTFRSPCASSSVHRTEMPMHVDERTDYLVRPIPEFSDLPLSLCQFLCSSDPPAKQLRDFHARN